MTKAFQACCGMPWHITRDGLSLILTIANREGLDVEAVEARLGRKLENTRTVTERNGVAVIPVTGPIFRYANLFSEISGATSIQVLARDFTTALNDPSVSTILLNIDSPGGEANGIAEFADMVYAGRAKKKVIAYIGGYGTSAAYWIASAADEIVINESGIAGSIGTIAAIPDPAVEHAGEVIIVSSQSPRKHADPTTEQGHADIQAVLDALTDVFVAAVARNRNVTPDAVLSDFGQGGLFVGQSAVAAGLVDRLGAFEGVLAGGMQARQDAIAAKAEARVERVIASALPALQISPLSAAPFIPAILILLFLASLGTTQPSPYTVYLPMIRTLPPVFPNGDFEMGRTGWVIPDRVDAVISNSPAPPITPHSGTWMARLVASQDYTLGTNFGTTIPISGARLQYWVWIRSTEQVCGMDRAGVAVHEGNTGLAGDAFELCAATQTSGWVKRTLDLSPYVGRTVLFEFVADSLDTATPNSTVFIDDVAWAP